MPIGRRNPRKKIILAGIQGVVIGVVGVLLFGFILNFANDKKENEKEKEVEEVNTPATKKEDKEKVEVTADSNLSLKAKQFGMFTTKESAMAFISEQPSLEKAGIVKIGDQFFVWGQLFSSEAIKEEFTVLPTFTKTLSVSTKSCENPKIKNVMQLLQEEKLSKKYFDSIAKKDDYPDDFFEIVQAVTTFTEDPSVIRLHIFTHYFEQNDCIKLNF